MGVVDFRMVAQAAVSKFTHNKLLNQDKIQLANILPINEGVMCLNQEYKNMQVSLKAMNQEAFSHYLEIAIPSYAKENIESGRWDESEALERSKQAHESLLPEREETKNNYLFNIIELQSQGSVGHIWVKVEDNIRTKSAFIYDIEIYENHRRKGYAKSALGCIEKVISDLGASSLRLHVFKHNSAAINLYNSIGYQTVSYNMQKPIRVTGT